MKNIYRIKLKNYSILNFPFLIIIIFITRFITYRSLYKKNLIEKISLEYLDSNFIDLFLFNHALPVGYFILQKILIVFNFHNLGLEFNFYALNIFYSIFFLYFLADILKNILKNEYIYPLLFIISFVLIPYETWRPYHHDHVNFFIFAYLFWSINYILNYKIKFNHLIFSLTLLNLFYSLGFICTFFVIFFLFILNKYKVYKIDLKSKLKLFFVIIFIFFIFTKNFINASIFASTSMGGANLIQRSIHAIGEDKFIDLIENKKLNLPVWWNQLSKEILKENKNVENESIRISKLAHGRLAGDKKKNFLIQKKIIESSNFENNEIIEIIDKDLINFEIKPWRHDLVYGQSLISTKYQSYGGQIFLKSCTLYPYDMIVGKIGNKGFILTAIKMISYGGLFPKYYENDKVYWNKIILFILEPLRFLILMLLCLTPYFFVKNLFLKKKNSNQIFYCFMVIFLILTTSIISIITCCENPRMMIMLFFVIILISIYNLTFSLKKNKL